MDFGTKNVVDCTLNNSFHTGYIIPHLMMVKHVLIVFNYIIKEMFVLLNQTMAVDLETSEKGEVLH